MRQYARKPRLQGQGTLLILAVMGGLLLWAFLTAQDKTKTGQLVKAVQGGQVRSPSGQAALSIPAGALAADTKITVAELPAMEGSGLGPVYDLQPDGLKFLKPAAFTVKYSPQEVAKEFEPEDVVLVGLTATGLTVPAANQQGQAEQPMIGWGFLETEVDTAAGSARAQLTHLSRYGLRACASWPIGEKDKPMKGKFDGGLKFHQAEGSGSAMANYQAKSGELFAWAEVPRGTEGMAMATSQMSKWFLVKPGKDGRRSTTNGRVAVKLKDKAKLGPDTNQYVISIVVQCYDARSVGELAQKHRQAAADLWLIREKYLSQITDLRMGEKSIETLQTERDDLLEELHSVYSGAPSTTYQAYRKAQEALKQLEDMTFSDAEIDAFLPKELKKG